MAKRVLKRMVPFRRWAAPNPEQIKELRKKLKMSQSTFCSTFGFDAATLRSWEQGKRIPGNSSSLLLMFIKVNPMQIRDLIIEIEHSEK